MAAPDLHLTPRGVRQGRRGGCFCSETRKIFRRFSIWRTLVSLSISTSSFLWNGPRALTRAIQLSDKREMFFAPPCRFCFLLKSSPPRYRLLQLRHKCSILANWNVQRLKTQQQLGKQKSTCTRKEGQKRDLVRPNVQRIGRIFFEQHITNMAASIQQIISSIWPISGP